MSKTASDKRSESGTLAEALMRCRITLAKEQITAIDRYCTLLWDYNQQLNLTRHTDYATFVERDVVDTLQLANLLQVGEEVLDIGSGGGVPGLLLAIIRPDVEVSVCDSVGKKAAVLKKIVEELGLSVPVYAERAADVLEDFRYSSVTARAVGPMWKILKWLESHWPSIGRLLLIKGPKWPEERGEARHRGLLKNLNLRRAASYPMPGTSSEGVILSISRSK